MSVTDSAFSDRQWCQWQTVLLVTDICVIDTHLCQWQTVLYLTESGVTDWQCCQWQCCHWQRVVSVADSGLIIDIYKMLMEILIFWI